MIETFLTAFDPSDLPGASIDPLGVEGDLFRKEKVFGMSHLSRS